MDWDRTNFFSKKQAEGRKLEEKIHKAEACKKASASSSSKRPERRPASNSDSDMEDMEVDMAEMRSHQSKFETWCVEAGQAQQHLQAQIGQLAATVSEHSTEITDMSKEIKSGFQNIEALLVKRSRTE